MMKNLFNKKIFIILTFIVSITAFLEFYNSVFAVAPTVITNSATSISKDYANLNGSINPNGSISAAWFEYGATQSLGNSNSIGSQSVNGNDFVNINTALYYLNPNTTYYFRAVAQNLDGIIQGAIMSFTTNSGGEQQIIIGQQQGQVPTVTTNSATSIYQNSATLNANVNPNNSNTNLWFEYGTTQNFGYSSVSQSVGSGNFSVSATGYVSGLLSNTNYYYRAIASNSYGTSYGSTYSFTTSNQVIQGSAPVATTNPATIFYTNSILLNGVINANGATTNAWFEYGTTLSLGQTTNSQSMGMGTIAYNYSYILSNLIPNTTYYFRAVSQNIYGTSYGTTLNFMSPVAATVVTTTNNYSASSATATIAPENSNSLAVVLISNVDKSDVSQGEEINYMAVYKNISDNDITDAKINIIFPEGIDYQSANINPSDQSAQNIIFNIEKILANGQGFVSAKAKINNSAKVGELVLNVNMNYVDSKNISQLAEASSTITIKENKSNLNLMASLIDTIGSFFKSWMFNIVLLGMVLGLGVYVIKYLKK